MRTLPAVNHADADQFVLLGSVCLTFLFLSGLSFRFLKATSLPAPSERNIILGVDRSLNLISVLTGSSGMSCFLSLSFDDFGFSLEKEDG